MGELQSLNFMLFVPEFIRQIRVNGQARKEGQVRKEEEEEKGMEGEGGKSQGNLSHIKGKKDYFH